RPRRPGPPGPALGPDPPARQRPEQHGWAYPRGGGGGLDADHCVSATVSLKTYSCWLSRVMRARLPSLSARTNSKPSLVGSMVMKEVVPSSLARLATRALKVTN